MSIRDEIKKETVPTIKELVYPPIPDNPDDDTFKGERKTYIFQGTSDADLMNRTILEKQTRIDLLKKHWKVVPEVGKELEDDTIRQVLLVHATLQPDKDELAYDIIEVASLSVKNGGLFMMMYGTAMTCIGNFDQVAAGNLEAPPNMNSNEIVGA